MNESVYLTLWAAYVFCAIGLLACAWWLFRGWLRAFTFPLVLILAALVGVPSLVAEGGEVYAPAFIVAVFDHLQSLGIGWIRAGTPLVIGLGAAVLLSVLWLVFVLVRYLRKT